MNQSWAKRMWLLSDLLHHFADGRCLHAASGCGRFAVPSMKNVSAPALLPGRRYCSLGAQQVKAIARKPEGIKGETE